ncbi:MAG: Holliday junction resolvase RuvX [Pseudomonadota bacterium]|nr:Holliday junction resolvase RuvX [Pseudomonadota bacterium]
MTIDTLPSNCDEPVTALAFDYGTQRIGVAFGQSVSSTAKAVTILKAKDGVPDWDQIQKLIDEWKPGLLVVGLPYNLDGTESKLLTQAIKFARRLNGRFNLPSFGIDERLSSKAAIEKVVKDSHGNKNKTAIDDIAAQIILENWFSEFNMKNQS